MQWEVVYQEKLFQTHAVRQSSLGTACQLRGFKRDQEVSRYKRVEGVLRDAEGCAEGLLRGSGGAAQGPHRGPEGYWEVMMALDVAYWSAEGQKGVTRGSEGYKWGLGFTGVYSSILRDTYNTVSNVPVEGYRGVLRGTEGYRGVLQRGAEGHRGVLRSIEGC